MSFTQTVEYLCTFDSSLGFCNSIPNLKSLFSAYDHITVKNDKIKWKDKEFKLEISKGDISGESSTFFHLILTNEKEENLDSFQELLKAIRVTLSSAGNDKDPLVLRDDISSNYAIKAYPIIHNLENSMRKLITKFMVTKVGKNSLGEYLPGEVSESVRQDGKKNITNNFLYKTDFIQLSNFLFREFSNQKNESIYSIIDKADKIDENDLKILKEKIPKSNWDRYFKPLIDCSSDELKSNWDELYKIRCVVAHNNFMSNQDFNNLVAKADKVSKFISSALEKLNQVEVKEDDKENILDSVDLNLNNIEFEFRNTWSSIRSSLKQIAYQNGLDSKYGLMSTTFFSTIQRLHSNSVLTSNEMDLLKNLRVLSNELLINPNSAQDKIEYFLEQAKEIDLKLKTIILQAKKATQGSFLNT